MMINCSIVLEGYLQKQSLYLKSYKKRWIVLKNDKKLYAFKIKPTDHEVLSASSKSTEIIDLLSCTNVTQSSQSSAVTTKWFEFTIHFNGNKKQRKFMAWSKEEGLLWIKCLKQVLGMEEIQINDSNDVELEDHDHATAIQIDATSKSLVNVLL